MKKKKTVEFNDENKHKAPKITNLKYFNVNENVCVSGEEHARVNDHHWAGALFSIECW